MRLTLCDVLEGPGMQNLGITRKSISTYTSPVVLVKKKDDPNRICVDYRRLNNMTIFNLHSMIPPADMFQGMENDRYFSKIYLSKGHWKIPVRQEDRAKIAFVTMDRHFELLRAPFRMMYSRATLARALKMLVKGLDYMVDYKIEL
ncbi:Zinc finger protein [Plakobranchus ocellatus]|uniref:Zinc finger protein n=1 Tax=Plakobranchus ocellatus TaxID=259542 RepID=A0AAV4C8Z3_9GAST|nr:Zinc finger protein [Plakobranchus ocellatus]